MSSDRSKFFFVVFSMVVEGFGGIRVQCLGV